MESTDKVFMIRNPQTGLFWGFCSSLSCNDHFGNAKRSTNESFMHDLAYTDEVLILPDGCHNEEDLIPCDCWRCALSAEERRLIGTVTMCGE